MLYSYILALHLLAKGSNYILHGLATKFRGKAVTYHLFPYMHIHFSDLLSTNHISLITYLGRIQDLLRGRGGGVRTNVRLHYRIVIAV